MQIYTLRMAKAGQLDQLEFNIFPFLRPAHNNYYAKISGKSTPNKYIRINNAVHADLEWAGSHLEWDTGIRILHQIHWDTSSTNITIYCNECLEGMGFWSPDKCVSYYSPVPETTTEKHIFYSEALCILSAVHSVTDSLCVPPTSKILIYTNNDNTVTIFNML